MDKIDRESFLVARRMARVVASSRRENLQEERRQGWDELWGACLTCLAMQYGWPVAHAVGDSVFEWRDIAKRCYLWSDSRRSWRFQAVQRLARRRAMGL